MSAAAVVCVIESMKMETEICAHRTDTISALWAVVGCSVAPGDVLAFITADEPDEEDIVRASATRGDPGGGDDGRALRALRARARPARARLSWPVCWRRARSRGRSWDG